MILVEFAEHGSLLRYLRDHRKQNYDNMNEYTVEISYSERLRMAGDVSDGMKHLAAVKVSNIYASKRHFFHKTWKRNSRRTEFEIMNGPHELLYQLCFHGNKELLISSVRDEAVEDKMMAEPRDHRGCVYDVITKVLASNPNQAKLRPQL